MILRFVEDELDVFRLPFFELLLKVATAMLILTKSVDLARQAVERNVSEAGSFCTKVSIIFEIFKRVSDLHRFGYDAVE